MVTCITHLAAASGKIVPIVTRPGSDLERAAAAARLDDVRVVEDEAALLEAVVEIDDGAVEVGVELLCPRRA